MLAELGPVRPASVEFEQRRRGGGVADRHPGWRGFSAKEVTPPSFTVGDTASPTAGAY
jgi:hypothetical protein